MESGDVKSSSKPHRLARGLGTCFDRFDARAPNIRGAASSPSVSFQSSTPIASPYLHDEINNALRAATRVVHLRMRSNPHLQLGRPRFHLALLV